MTKRYVRPRLTIQFGAVAPMIVTTLEDTTADNKQLPLCRVTMTPVKPGEPMIGASAFYAPGEVVIEQYEGIEGLKLIGKNTIHTLMSAWTADDAAEIMDVFEAVMMVTEGMAAVAHALVLASSGDYGGYQRVLNELAESRPVTFLDAAGKEFMGSDAIKDLNVVTPFTVDKTSPVLVMATDRYCPAYMTEFRNVGIPDLVENKQHRILAFEQVRITHFEQAEWVPTAEGAESEFIGCWRYPWAAIGMVSPDGICFTVRKNMEVYVYTAGAVTPVGQTAAPEGVWRMCGNERTERDDWMDKDVAWEFTKKHAVPNVETMNTSKTLN